MRSEIEPAQLTPAQRLKGLVLDGGWLVVEHLDLKQITTGGWFSEAYIVEDGEGRRAFMKAMDFSAAINSDDPAGALKLLTETYVYERDLLRASRTFDRVVVAISDGMVKVGTDPVQYLLFERADSDLRVYAEQSASFELACALRALHHMATGLGQLHGSNITHQDLKPSNVLVFGAESYKIADLGRAVSKGGVQPNEHYEVPGAKAYAPLELLYRFIQPDWNCRRRGADAYLLGSMVVFCFSGAGMTSLIQSELVVAHRWTEWGGTYEEVLPYIREAFERVIETVSASIPESTRPQLVGAIRQLCEPDPRLRGDRKALRGSAAQYSVERFRTLFDSLASKAERGIRVGPFGAGAV